MTVLTQSQSKLNGLRPMNPLTDLRGVADLIEEAFVNDLDHSGQSALQELRWLSYFRPLLWWFLLVDFGHNNFLSGFVWEADGSIVGNVTINQMEPFSRRWLISNVAVSKPYRRQGIARQLLCAGEDLAKTYNGSHILLQVRADNRPAKDLDHHLGVRDLGGTACLTAPRVVKTLTPPFPSGLTIRPRRPTSLDNLAAYRLAQAAIPKTVQEEWSLRQSQFSLPLSHQLNNLARRLVSHGHLHWVVVNGRDFVATIAVKPELFGKPHTIELMVHPDWRGYLEKPLLSRAVNYLWQCRPNTTVIKHPADHTEAIEAYREYGFREEQTLIWMKRSL